MVSNSMVRFRVSQTQLDRIKFDAKLKGYKTYSAYVRDIALRGDHYIETKIIGIGKDVKQILMKLK